MLKKGGEAVELKNFDFTRQIYTDNPDRAVARILKQVESRALPGVNKVTAYFCSAKCLQSSRDCWKENWRS